MKSERTVKRWMACAGMVSMVILGMSVGFSNAEMDHYASHTGEPAMPKMSGANRMTLDISPAAKEGLKLTMREHLEAIDAIVGALGREDFAGAATLTNEELGFPKHHVAMQREQGATFPPEYHELAMAHHQAAEALGAVIPTRDLKKILPHLEQTIHACVKCHQVFRLQN